MLRLLMSILRFRVGQKASKGFAHSLGLRAAAPLIGLIGGMKYMRRH